MLSFPSLVDMDRFVALVPAAGIGSRFGGETPKQYLPVRDRPLLWYALQALAAHPAIARVLVVLHPDDRQFASLSWVECTDKLVPLYAGGATRAHSVCGGLCAPAAQLDDDDWVLVHDAARPCLDRAMLDRLIDTLRDDAVGGLLAVPVADTLKREDAEQRIAATEPRAGLWRAQTPQMFRAGPLRRALESADLALVTDEASAVEALGLRPKLVMGSDLNIKVTYPEDLNLADLILAARER
jgi:2-C-methyl-D-erythritol 4-phosphate cytidylyltransferase